MQPLRVARGRSSEISTVVLDPQGVAVPQDQLPADAAVTIVSHDGTELVEEADATASDGRLRYTLDAADAADLDRLTATWLDGSDTIATSTIEIVGGFLFEVQEAKDDPNATVLRTKTPELIAEYRTKAERDLEDAVNIAFVPRYWVETFNAGVYRRQLRLATKNVISLRRITVAGEALSEDDLAACEIRNVRDVYRPGGFSGQVEVAYEAGLDRAPSRAGRAALAMAEHLATERSSNLNERATRFDSDMGSYTLVTAGTRGARFSIPEANAVVDEFFFDNQFGID